MDFNLKQWRDEEEAEASSASKLHKLHTDDNNNHNSSTPASSSVTKFFTKMGSSSSSSYFSLAQWQELELQALIFRHFIAGAAVPPELLHLVNKTLINYPPHHYLYHHPPLLQTGYWGKGAMDPEPGRCRRTDGKKWRCSRDVVAGQKYCERHMHRGRNRSRKPVEFPATAAAASAAAYGGDALKPAQGISAPHFTLSGSLTSMDLLHRNPRPLDTIYETKRPLEAQNDGQSDGGRTLRCFFDDWPRSDNGANTVASSTNLSISTPSNPSSDFSLKLGTGNGDESRASGGRERPQLNWGMIWETNRVAPMGGPLAEALRSSASTSSPTSVLHRLARSSASETSFVSS